jgi:integrase
MIYKRGKQGIYWYRFRFAGRMIHESAKTHSKTLARDGERQRRRDLETKWNRIEKRSLPPTLTAAAKRWLEKRAGLGSNTLETYKAALKHVRASLGTMLVCEIEARDILAYQKARLEQQAAGATINKEITCLSAILGDCGVWEHVRRDVRRLQENEEAGRALSRDEEKRLLEFASIVGQRQGNWTPLYTVTVLGLNTGMRHKEIRKLKWKNLDLENRVLRVGESKTEAGKGRPVPLTQPAWAALDLWASRFPDRKPEHFVFPACENGRINLQRPIDNWRTAWRRATRAIHCPACCQLQNPGNTCCNGDCKADIRSVKSPIDRLRFHDLRHTAATKLLEQGTPTVVVAQILGWSASTALRMVKRYGHIRPEVQRKALSAVATAEIQGDVHQIVHQAGSRVEFKTPN